MKNSLMQEVAWSAPSLMRWEALTIFGVANLVAFMSGLDAIGYWFVAAMVWVIARVFHGVFYTVNIPVLRIICFSTGLGMSLWIVFMAATF